MSMLTFGPFRLDDRTLELWRDGRPIPIRPQPCRLLSLLVARPGELVTREDIAAMLWPGVHVRFDLGLNSCLKQIRAALDDDADRPRWIETLSRRGYRFIGVVRRDERGPMSAIRRLLVLPVRPIEPTDERIRPLLPGLKDDIEAGLAQIGPSIAIVPAGTLPDDVATRPSLRGLGKTGVDFVLEARAYCEGSEFRISAQLVDVAEHVVTWAAVFDGSIDARFATQRQVAFGIRAAVRSALGLERPRQLAG